MKSVIHREDEMNDGQMKERQRNMYGKEKEKLFAKERAALDLNNCAVKSTGIV